MGRGLWQTGDALPPDEMPDEPTIVVFRRYDNGDIVALFPEDEDAGGRCSSYSEGYHGSAYYLNTLVITSPATPDQYGPLKAALEEMGFRLDVRERYTLEGR